MDKAKLEEIKKFNNQGMGEEIANAISHGVGALLAIAGTAVMIVSACFTSDAMGITCATLYGTSLIILYLCSTLYHSITNITAKRVFQIFDHCSIFILILGSYIPISLALIRGVSGWVLFGINAFCTILGVTFNAIDMKRWQGISLVLYILMGWSVIFTFKPVLHSVPLLGILFLIAGGLFYSIGVIFYKMKKTKYMHSLWHIFVLGGSVFHYFFILFYVLPINR